MNLIEYHKYMFLDNFEDYTEKQIQITIDYFNQSILEDRLQKNFQTYNLQPTIDYYTQCIKKYNNYM